MQNVVHINGTKETWLLPGIQTYNNTYRPFRHERFQQESFRHGCFITGSFRHMHRSGIQTCNNDIQISSKISPQDAGLCKPQYLEEKVRHLARDPTRDSCIKEFIKRK